MAFVEALEQLEKSLVSAAGIQDFHDARHTALAYLRAARPAAGLPRRTRHAAPGGLARRGPGRLLLVRAGDLEEAVELARSCASLRFGGSVTVRPVDPT